jgi:light-regulated signal transduction histidine kinase (bacteriophytochrome)
MPSEVSTSGGDKSVEELRRELADARKQQAATADSLRVISNSPTDLQLVFGEIAANAARLCDAYDAAIRQVDGDFLLLVAQPVFETSAENAVRLCEARPLRSMDALTRIRSHACRGRKVGIAFAKQIAEMHGGRIWVESTLGEGSTFQMHFPTRAELRKAAP